MNTLNILELRARLSQACNAAIEAGTDAVTIAMVLDSVSSDLKLQASYKALSELQAETQNNQEEDTNV